MDDLTLKGVWTNELVYKAIKNGFNSTKLKGISQNKNGNVFMISGLNKLKVTLKPNGDDTIFKARMTFPFGWSPLGWCLIIPSALLCSYMIGIPAVIALWIISFVQEKNFNKEVYEYLSAVEPNSIPQSETPVIQQQTEISAAENGEQFDNLKKIEELNRLLQEGILTQDEFQSKKEKLLETI